MGSVNSYLQITILVDTSIYDENVKSHIKRQKIAENLLLPPLGINIRPRKTEKKSR